jgi:hypothetical protein
MSGQRTPEEIRADIEHTREELGETAAALAEKADVKAHVHDRVEETKAKARTLPLVPIAGGVVVALIALRVTRTRRAA